MSSPWCGMFQAGPSQNMIRSHMAHWSFGRTQWWELQYNTEEQPHFQNLLNWIFDGWNTGRISSCLLCRLDNTCKTLKCDTMAKQQMKIRDVLQHVNGTLVLHRSSTDNRYWPYTDRNTRIIHEFLLLILMFNFVFIWHICIILEFPVLMQNVYTIVIFAGDSSFFPICWCNII